MKLFTRIIVLLLIVLLGAGPVPAAIAQDGGGAVPNCNGLSDADCEIIQASMAAMQTIRSFSVPAWNLTFDVQAGAESMAFAANGTGAAILPPSIAAWMSDLPPITGATNLGPVIAVLETLDAALIEQALAEIGLYLAVDGAMISLPGETASGGAEILLKDNGLYMRFESPTGAEAWFGDTFDLTESDLTNLNESLDEMIAALQADDVQQALAQLSEFSGTMTELQALVSQYVVTTRGPDVELVGQPAGTELMHFTTTFDLPGLINDPALAGLVYQVLQNPALGELDVDLQDLENVNETQVQFVLMTVGMLLGDTTLLMDQVISPDDLHVVHFGYVFEFDVDLSLFGSEADFDRVAITVTFDADLADFNSASLDDVAIPSSYHDLDETESFLVGSPEMIDSELQVGQTYSAAFKGDGDDRHIYALALEAGDTIQFELESDDYPYLALYGPDGFEVASFDTYYDDVMAFTAEAAGQYLVVVEASWSMNYDLTIRRS